MIDNDLPATSALDRRQSPPRRDVLGGTVTTEERSEVLAAFEQAGFKTISQGVRVIALAFTRSARVRDDVAAWFRANVEEAS